MKGEAINVRSRDIAKKLLFHFGQQQDLYATIQFMTTLKDIATGGKML